MYLLSVLAVLVVISAIPIVLSDSMRGDFTIPNWVKNTAGWWADDKIPDSSFIETIEFLIKDEMITVKIPDLDSEVVNKIPAWVKNTAGWWAEDKVHDTTFVAAIRYLVSQGIVYVEREQVEVAKCNFKGKEVVCSPFEKEVEEITDFYMELNGSNCCLNWAYVGEEYEFQIETLDEYRGNPIDGVTITAKIISKGGEIRHNFGQVTTEDGIYRNSVIIPSMDWYAENILSVTGEYYGVEKIIEKEFDVFKSEQAQQHCFKISCYTIKSVSNVSDSTNLDGVRGVETVTMGDSTYVVAAAQLSDKIVIFDISDPTNPTSVGSLADGGSRKLNNPYDVAITTIGDSTYAVVTAYWDHGIDVIDISDPTNPTSVGTFADTGTYSGTVWDCVSSLGAIGDHRCLRHPVDVEITTIGGSTYAVVAGSGDDGIEIIDISDPTNPEEAGRMTDRDDRTRELDGANGVAITTIGSSTCAVVTGTHDDGISIIDISTPSSPVYVSELEDGTDTGVCTAANGERCLDGPRDVEIETINGLTYAIVVSYLDDALTIIDITNVSNPTIVASMYNSSTKELDAAKGVSIVTIDGSTYAIVGATTDDGIEIIRIMDHQI